MHKVQKIKGRKERWNKPHAPTGVEAGLGTSLRDSCSWKGRCVVVRALNWESCGFHVGFLFFEARGLGSVI